MGDIFDQIADENTGGDIFDQIVAESVPTESTPEWAGKYPNLYGVYGATVGTLQKLGEYSDLDKPAETIGKTAAYLTRPSNVTPEMAKAAGLKPTTGEVVGGSLQIASTLLPYGKIAKGAEKLATVAKAGPKLAKYGATAAIGAVGGYTYEAGEKISKGETPTPGVKTVVGALVPTAIEGAVNVFKSKPYDTIISNTVKKGINKGIRPSVQSTGKSSVQSKAYYDKAQKAVETIVKNKPNLEFVDDAGEVAKGALPKSLSEFSDAIDQTKKAIFAQYDDLATKAGQQGATVDLAPVAKELESLVNNKVINDLNPNVVEYAKARAATLTERRAYSAEEAQEAVTMLNNSLKSFYSNPTYDNASKAAVDAMVASKIRQSLDDVIEKASGAGYQELKNTYGALKALEKDVSHRGTIDARKNIKGLVDHSDIYSGATLVSGLMTMNPAVIGAAITAKSIAAYNKHINNPNRVISNMFGKTEKLLSKKSVPVKPSAPTLRFPGDIIADEVPSKVKSVMKMIFKKDVSAENKATMVADTLVKHGGFKALPMGEATKALPPTKNIKALSAGEILELYGPDGQFIITRQKGANVIRRPRATVETKYYKKIDGAVIMYDPSKESFFMLPDNITEINKKGTDLLELAEKSLIPQSKVIEPSSTSKLLEAAQKSQSTKSNWENIRWKK